MEKRIVYHGSDSIIEKPIFGFKNNVSDYGDGFYCTQDIESAKEWANKNVDHGFVNQYEIDFANLKILDLTNGDYSVFHWITLLFQHRLISETIIHEYSRELDYLFSHYSIDTSNYDVIIGYRADDSYFLFPLAFLRSEITIDKLEEIYLLGELGKQVVLISEKAFSNIKFIKYIDVPYGYKKQYKNRILEANKKYRELFTLEHYSSGKRLIDLVRDKND